MNKMISLGISLIVGNAVIFGMDPIEQKKQEWNLIKTIDCGQAVMQADINESGRFIIANVMNSKALIFDLTQASNDPAEPMVPVESIDKNKLRQLSFKPCGNTFTLTSENSINIFEITENKDRQQKLIAEEVCSFSYGSILTKLFSNKNNTMLAASLWKEHYHQTEIIDMKYQSKLFDKIKPISCKGDIDYAQFNYTDTLLALAEGCKVKIMDMQTGNCVGNLNKSLCMLPLCWGKNNLLAMAPHGKEVRVYDVDNNNEIVASFFLERGAVKLCFSPCNRFLAIGLSELSDTSGDVVIYDLNSQKRVGVIDNGGRVNSATFDVTGKKLLTASADGMIRLFSLDENV